MTSTIPGASTDAQSAPFTPPHYGGTREEFQALLTHCGIYDLRSRAKIRLTGSDRVRWLNGMVTNNVRDLAPNHGVYCFLLNAQGHIQSDLYAYNLGDSLMVDVESQQREKVLAHFEKFIIMDDVEVADLSATVVALGLGGGPLAGQVLAAAGIKLPGGLASGGLAPLEICEPKCECACECLKCTLVRTDDPAGNSFELWLAPDQWKSTWEGLLAAGAKAVGTDALEQQRIRWGIPRYGVDIRERDLPQETGQIRALNFSKGCYLGQEIVERIRSRGAVHRHFAAFLANGPLPSPGTKIQAAEKDVGEVTSSANLQFAARDRAVVLGYLRREAAGKELHAGSAVLVPATIPID